MKVCINKKGVLVLEFLKYYNYEDAAPPEGNLFLDTIDLVGRLSGGNVAVYSALAKWGKMSLLLAYLFY